MKQTIPTKEELNNFSSSLLNLAGVIDNKSNEIKNVSLEMPSIALKDDVLSITIEIKSKESIKSLIRKTKELYLWTIAERKKSEQSQEEIQSKVNKMTG